MKNIAVILSLLFADYAFAATAAADVSLRGKKSPKPAPGDDSSSSSSSEDESVKDAPTKAQVDKALNDWGLGLVSISTATKQGKTQAELTTIATNVIKTAYNYDDSIVLFKPTVAVNFPFRTTFDGALSYFIGGNAAFAEDSGFAKNPFVSVVFDVRGYVYEENRAFVQGFKNLTLDDATTISAHFSMGFTRKSKNADLKIDLHHSSLPYTPPAVVVNPTFRFF
jgi:hypothetical protein